MTKFKLSHEQRPNSIIYPMALLGMRHFFTVRQGRVLFAIVRKLQKVLTEHHSGIRKHCDSPFPDEKVVQGWVIISLPLSLIDGARKNLCQLRNAIRKMEEHTIEVLLNTGREKRWVKVEKPFRIGTGDSPADKQCVRIYIKKVLADVLFDMRKGYINVCADTFLAITHRVTQLIYLVLAGWEKRGVVRYNFSTLIMMTGVSSRFTYSRFRDEKLEVARKELKSLYDAGKCRFYFTYQPVYQGTIRWGEPASILFRIHTGDGNSCACAISVEQLQETVAHLLVKFFRMDAPHVKQVTERINELNYSAVVRKLNDLRRHILHKENAGQYFYNKSAYVTTAVIDLINTLQPEVITEQARDIAA